MKIVEGVQGFGDRRNTLLIAPRSSPRDTSHQPDETVVFFPGDVQNFEAAMKHHLSYRKWRDWTFENTVDLLQERFPHAHVVMVTPSRSVEETFSCYDNFMELDVMGSPVSSDYHNAWEHLKLLVEAALTNIREELARVTEEADGGTKQRRHQTVPSNLTLIGFSKGCTILNQLMYELKEAESSPSLLAFIRQVQSFYWLDGGHSGTIPTYIIDQGVLREIANLKASFHVHVTPYQVKDEARPHIGEEHMIFISFLFQYGADLKNTLHFRDESRSLKRHFEVLTLF